MSTEPGGWSEPKTNWAKEDVPLHPDFNRIEGNISAVETGERTIDPAQAPTGNAGALRQFLDWFANRLKAITGAANWYDPPAITLAGVMAKLHETTGHKHTGTAGDGPKIGLSGLDSTATTSGGGTEAGRLALTDLNGRVGAARVADNVLEIQKELVRNFYDDYLRQLELYYTGHFSGPEIAGQKGMTFDGFADTSRVDLPNTTATVNTSLQDVRSPLASITGYYHMPNAANGASNSGCADAYDFTNVGNMVDADPNSSAYHSAGSSEHLAATYHDLGSFMLLKGIRALGYRASAGAGATLEGIYVSDGQKWFSKTGLSAVFPESAAQWVECNLDSPTYGRYVVLLWRVYKNTLYVNDLEVLTDQVVDSVFRSTVKTLPVVPARLRAYVSHREYGDASISVRCSLDGGSTWEAMTIQGTRADPLDSAYTEEEFGLTPSPSGTSLVFRVDLTKGSDNMSFPILKRYGIHWS